eukprot:2649968-Alexandrium_andersonii.AAC.1
MKRGLSFWHGAIRSKTAEPSQGIKTRHHATSQNTTRAHDTAAIAATTVATAACAAPEARRAAGVD